jgi:hypothetical protein
MAMQDEFYKFIGGLLLIAIIAGIVFSFRLLRRIATASMLGHHLVRLLSAIVAAAVVGAAAHSFHAVVLVPADQFPKQAHPEIFYVAAGLLLVPLWLLFGESSQSREARHRLANELT